MAIWKRNRQEYHGKYRLASKLYITTKVLEQIPTEEIAWIVHDVKTFVEEQDGIDYLQVYEDENGRKLFFIDQLNDI